MRTRIVLLLLICATHVGSYKLAAQQTTPRPETNLQVQQGRAAVLRLEKAAARVFIADTAVATFQIIDARQLVVRGVNPGATRMTVLFSDSTRRVYAIEVKVPLDRTEVEVMKEGARQRICFGPGCSAGGAQAYTACASSVTGNFGFTLRCNGGECSMDQTGYTVARNVFTVEPVVESITARGPAEGRLRTGDAIVAVDGLLITTRDAGARLANVAQGDSVELRIRRENREESVHVVAALGCRPYGATTNWLYTDSVAAMNVAGRGYRSLSQQYASALDVARSASSAPGEPATPSVDFGMSLECDWCGWRRVDSRATWWSYEAPRVSSVDAQGPAAAAGVRPGDILIAINGARFVNSHVGTISPVWAALKPGVAATLTVQRNGDQVDIRITPRAARKPF